MEPTVGALALEILSDLRAALVRAKDRARASENEPGSEADGEAVHDLRVSARRLREMLKLFAPVMGQAALDV